MCRTGSGRSRRGKGTSSGRRAIHKHRSRRRRRRRRQRRVSAQPPDVVVRPRSAAPEAAAPPPRNRIWVLRVRVWVRWQRWCQRWGVGRWTGRKRWKGGTILLATKGENETARAGSVRNQVLVRQLKQTHRGVCRPCVQLLVLADTDGSSVVVFTCFPAFFAGMIANPCRTSFYSCRCCCGCSCLPLLVLLCKLKRSSTLIGCQPNSNRGRQRRDTARFWG